MAYYPDGSRMRQVVDVLTESGPMDLAQMSASVDMCRHTTWKCLHALVSDGTITYSTVTTRHGHLKHIYELEDFLDMDEQRSERLVSALERIADCMEQNAKPKGPKRETKDVNEEETK